MKGYVFLLAVPMRAEASDRAEMVNQLLAGDVVEVIERQEKWSKVRCEYDGYEGWVDNKQYVPFDSAADLAERCFLGTPYLWGGRSRGGIDCSGLTQVCFKAMDIWLPGMVRIDTLDRQGIFDGERYTHRLHSVRRVIG